MKFSHTVDFRTGAGGKITLLPYQKSGPNISLLPLNVFVCPDCGKIELFAGEAIKDALLRVAERALL
jgi:hypothetical protein